MPIAVSVVCNQIIPYRVPVFDALARDPRFSLEVIYLSDREANRQWRAPRLDHAHRVLPSLSTYVTSRDWPIHLQWGLRSALRRHAPEVVVTLGYDTPGFWQAAAWASQHGAGRVLYFGSTQFSSRTHGGPIAALRRHFVRRTHAFLAYGTWARDYLLAMGAHWDDVFVGFNTVDVAAIAAATAAATPWPRKAEHELLFVGQCIRRKGLAQLFRALATTRGPSWRLHVVGSGPLQSRMQSLSRRLGIDDRVLFHGYQHPENLYPLLALCDILVMPSLSEVWGLVVNEALAAGLFVVVGERAGCVPDLVRLGENGFTADPTDVGHLAKALQRAMQTPKDRQAIAQSVLQHTPKRIAAGLAAAVWRAWEKTHPHARSHEAVISGPVGFSAP